MHPSSCFVSEVLWSDITVLLIIRGDSEMTRSFNGAEMCHENNFVRRKEERTIFIV